MVSIGHAGTHRVFVVACLFATGVAGCKTATLSVAGSRVATSQSAPIDSGFSPSACRPLGYVVGRGGGSFGGGWISNESLVKYAMNDLQNNVAKLGGNFVQHDTPQLGVAGDKYGTTTSTATVSGTAYFCDPKAARSMAHAPLPPLTAATVSIAAPQPKKVELTAPPEGAGGFRFGDTLADAQAACASRGYKWKRSGSDAECSNPLVAIAASAHIVLHACQDAICGVEVLATEPAERILAKYDELYAALEQKYGVPKQRRAPLDAACSANLAACLSGPSPPAGAAWRWPDGHVLEASLVATGGSVIVNLRYSNPERSKSVTPGPAL